MCVCASVFDEFVCVSVWVHTCMYKVFTGTCIDVFVAAHVQVIHMFIHRHVHVYTFTCDHSGVTVYVKLTWPG